MGKMDAISPSQFQRVHINHIPIVEDLNLLNFFLYDVDIVEGTI